MQSAAQQVLESIDQLLVEQDDHLVMPMTTLNVATAAVVKQNAQIITKMQEKLIRTADRQTTKAADVMDTVFTRVLAGLDDWQHNVNFLLTQLAAKGGFTKAGEPLEAALQAELAQAPQLAYQGTLVLAIKEAVPFLEQLIEVLREIRDRLPGTPVEYSRETHAEGDPEAVIDAGDETGTTIDPGEPTLRFIPPRR